MGPGVDLHRRDNLPAAGDMPAGGELQIAAYASPQHREEHRVRSSAHGRGDYLLDLTRSSPSLTRE